MVLLALLIAMGLVLDTGAVCVIAGMILVGWAAYHWFYDHRHRVRIGMTDPHCSDKARLGHRRVVPETPKANRWRAVALGSMEWLAEQKEAG